MMWTFRSMILSMPRVETYTLKYVGRGNGPGNEFKNTVQAQNPELASAAWSPVCRVSSEDVRSRAFSITRPP